MKWEAVDPSVPALFRRHPRLATGLPHRSFLPGPTPVEALTIPGLGGRSLLVKRDDVSCPLYAGNKPRKLEFLIGRAQARGVRRLVTTGGLGTNHGLATTILAREVGMETTLVLVDQPITPKVRESLLLYRAYGAEVVHGRNVPGTAAAVARILARCALRGERAELIPTGGTSPLGLVGIVSAGIELACQVERDELPEPAAIFVAVGTGGTLAGLALGLHLGGLASRLVGVLVTDILPPNERRLARLARSSLALLRRHDPGLPDDEIPADSFELARGELGPGYGASTPAAEAAVRSAASAGLSLETTYTGKCLAEILRRAGEDALPKGPVLFWNTYNGVDVAAHAPRHADIRELPGSIQRLLKEEEVR